MKQIHYKKDGMDVVIGHSDASLAIARKEADEGSISVKYAADELAPMSALEVLKMLLPQQVNTLEVDDNTALRMKNFYPEWAAGISCTIGLKLRHGEELWRCRNAHTSQIGWEPENAPALWEQICETHTGTPDDPIPYDGNMALCEGLYYHQSGVLYLCDRDTGNPVYHALKELVGLYVTAVT